MEPAGPIARVVEGILERADGSHSPVRAIIFEPIRNEEHGDYSCIVRCRFLFDEDKRIAGADLEQAVELAVILVRPLLQAKGIVLTAERAPDISDNRA